MAVRTKMLWIGQATGISTTIYTVPSGHRTIVKKISLWNSSIVQDVSVNVRAVGGSTDLIQWVHKSMGVHEVLHLDLWDVLDEGYRIRLGASSAIAFNSLKAHLSGTELDLTP